MSLVVYNTMTRRHEPFHPVSDGRVSIYVCGITPYDKSHIGHARPSVFWDVVRRYLTYLGYKVTLVQNFTDIEDKIIKKSKETGLSAKEIAEKYATEYLELMDKLGVIRADYYPRATEVIPEIIEMISVLIEKGYAYASGGDVYFRARRFREYGKLSGKNIEELLPGARVSVSELKEDPLDWALWKASPDDEPGWDSPWGRGRPGWHIECSVMVNKFLGPRIDFHGGGTELIFPHHEDEIAQSEAYLETGPVVKYWMHNEILTLSGEKMSKSLGNTVSLEDVLMQHDPMAVRLYLLSAHRRKALEMSDELLASAEKGWERISNACRMAFEYLKTPTSVGAGTPDVLNDATAKVRQEFFAAMDDDFNTPAALGSLYEFISVLNSQVTARDSGSPQGREAISRAFGTLVELTGILGLVPEKAFGAQATQDISADLIKAIVDIRNQARQEKNYKVADQIRERLRLIGVSLEDTPSGTNWRFSR